MFKSKRKIVCYILLIVLCAISVSIAFGASVSASLSGGGPYNKGDTVSVTLTYSG